VYTIPAKSRKRDEEAGGDMGSEVRKRLSPSLNTAAVVDQGERDGGEQREGAAPSLPVKPSLVKRILIRLRSIRIASMPTFWIIAINGFLVTLGYPVPYIYLGRKLLRLGPRKSIFITLYHHILPSYCAHSLQNWPKKMESTKWFPPTFCLFWGWRIRLAEFFVDTSVTVRRSTPSMSTISQGL